VFEVRELGRGAGKNSTRRGIRFQGIPEKEQT